MHFEVYIYILGLKLTLMVVGEGEVFLDLIWTSWMTLESPYMLCLEINKDRLSKGSKKETFQVLLRLPLFISSSSFSTPLFFSGTASHHMFLKLLLFSSYDPQDFFTQHPDLNEDIEDWNDAGLLAVIRFKFEFSFGVTDNQISPSPHFRRHALWAMTFNLFLIPMPSYIFL